MATDPLEARLARLEGSYEQIDRRLATIEGDIRELRVGMDEHFRFLISQINRQMYWLAGILVTSLGSLAVSLLILLLRP